MDEIERQPEQSALVDAADDREAITELDELASRDLAFLKPVIVPGKEEEAAVLIRALEIKRSYRGPIPTGREMAVYEQTLPGSADRLISMAEKNLDARIESQKLMVQTEAKMRLRGQPLALVALLVICGLVLTFLFTGHATPAATVAVALVALVTAMFLGPEILKLIVRHETRVGSEDDEE